MADNSEIEKRVLPSGFRELLGYRTRTWRDGFGEIELVLKPSHMNRIGIVHGGVYCALLDVAMGHAAAYCAVPGHARFSVTLSLNTTFLKGARGGVLIATGTLDGVDGRAASTTGEVRDGDGVLCATGQATFLYAPGSECKEGVPIAQRPFKSTTGRN